MKTLLEMESLPTYAYNFNKFSLELLLILLAFILKFHSYIMVIEGVDREREREKEESIFLLWVRLSTC